MTNRIAMAAAMSALFLSAPLAAGEEMNTVRVTTADLDLRSDNGQRVLDRRIAAASKQVCGVRGTRGLSQQSTVQRCVTDTMADARKQRDRLVTAARDNGTRLSANAIR